MKRGTFNIYWCKCYGILIEYISLATFSIQPVLNYRLFSLYRSAFSCKLMGRKFHAYLQTVLFFPGLFIDIYLF